MRDHRSDMSELERERAERDKVEVTELMRSVGPKFVPTRARQAKRARRRQQAASRRANRR